MKKLLFEKCKGNWLGKLSSLPKHNDKTKFSSILMSSVIVSLKVSEKTDNSWKDEKQRKLSFYKIFVRRHDKIFSLKDIQRTEDGYKIKSLKFKKILFLLPE